MHFAHALLGLAASASAIDVYFHNAGDCSGAAAVCSNINPNFCCTGDSQTVAYRGIPTNWHLNIEGYSGGGCRFTKFQSDVNGANWLCLPVNSRDHYTGTFYWFASRRRAEQANCTGSVKPDTLVLADGVTKYDIVGLEDAKVEKLVSVVFMLSMLAGERCHRAGMEGACQDHELTGLIFQALHCWYWSWGRGHARGLPGPAQVNHKLAAPRTRQISFGVMRPR